MSRSRVNCTRDMNASSELLVETDKNKAQDSSSKDSNERKDAVDGKSGNVARGQVAGVLVEKSATRSKER